MLDCKKVIVTELKKVHNNVAYELVVESPTFPLITYTVINDAVHAYGNTLGYSDVKYQIKVWTDKVSELATLTEDVDKKLKAIGLSRTYYTELKENEVIVGVMQYNGLIHESFIGGQ